MIRPNRIVLLAVVLACGVASGTAFAQAAARQAQTEPSYPEAETALGWTYLHPYNGGPDSKLGGALAANYNLASWLGIVVDAGVNHFNGAFPDGTGWGQTEYTVLGGARLALRQFGSVTPYAHLLAGYGRANLDVNGANSGSDYFVIQPGGGVDIGTGKYGLRVEVSWRRMFDQSGGINRLRVMAGLVVRSAPKRAGGGF